MKDFKESLLVGINAAKFAESNREEIKAVLKNINDQICDFSSNKATFGIKPFSREEVQSTKSVFPTVADLFHNKKYVWYRGLAISDCNGNDPIEIAKWSESDGGYPCTITFGGEKFVCGKKAELENALSTLLQEVKTGEAILEKIRMYDESHVSEIQDDKQDNNDDSN